MEERQPLRGKDEWSERLLVVLRAKLFELMMRPGFDPQVDAAIEGIGRKIEDVAERGGFLDRPAASLRS